MELRTVIDRLKAYEPELRRSGVLRLSVFGSTAKAESGTGSDVDLAAIFDPKVKISLSDHIRIEDRLAEILGTEVDLVTEPVSRKPRLQAEIDKHRVVAF